MNKNLSSARLVSTVCKIFFLFVTLFSIFCFAIGVTSVGVEGKEDIALLGFTAGIGTLLLSMFVVFLFHMVENVYRAAAEADAKKALEEFPGEDGLSGDFCREIFSYSPAQLRLILDEQKDDYTPEEYAYIQKILDRKMKNI